MHQRPTGLNVTKAITGFLQYKSTEGLSPVTVKGYDNDLKLWIEYQGDMDVAAVETTHILAYLNYLRTDYVPRRITGNNDKKLSPKTVYNLYISVASFFTWASKEFQIHNPDKGVPRPRVPEDAPVEPFKKEEIELLIKACAFCEEAPTDSTRQTKGVAWGCCLVESTPQITGCLCFVGYLPTFCVGADCTSLTPPTLPSSSGRKL